MKKAWGCLGRGCLVTGVTFIALFAIGVALIARYSTELPEAGTATSPLDAVVHYRMQIAEDSSALVDESFRIDTTTTRNGNGRRWLFTPEGVSVEFLGVDDVTGGVTRSIAGATFTRQGEGVEIAWKYEPESGVRTFVVRYEIVGAVRSFAGGGSVMNWTFFDRSNPLPMADFSAEIEFPADTTFGSEVFGHIGKSVQDLTPTGTTVSWNPGPSRSSTIIELLAEFESPTLYRGAPRLYPGSASSYASAKKAEESYVPPPKEPPPRPSRITVLLPLGIAPLLILLLLLFQWRYGREYKIKDAPMYERELPSDETPAEVGWLKRFGESEIEDITATIVDLARRGFLRIGEASTAYGPDIVLTATPERAKGQPASHEFEVLSWIFPDPGGVTYMSGINTAVRANPVLWQNFWSNFKSGVGALCEGKGFMEVKKGGTVPVLIRLGGVAIAVGSTVVGALTALTWVLVAAAGAVWLAFGGQVKRRSLRGAETWAKWDAFRAYIHDFSMLADVPPAGYVMWEEYLAYAVPLEEADTVMSYMQLRPPVAGQNDWYPSYPGFVTVMESRVSSIASSASVSTSGGGGGFGGGGGASFD
ncbi:MAG: hypothetical protein DCC49_11365 [Acidobacteria bacterium]|nr:MAG: hypothetical protein DCC49_11365 [Acidobacteriota bacterium]